MSRLAPLALILLAGILFNPACLAGQAIPRTNVVEIAPPVSGGIAYDYEHGEPGAVAFDGGFAVCWSAMFVEGDEFFNSIQARLLDATGRLGARLETDSAIPHESYFVQASIARESSGEILLTWSGEESYLIRAIWAQRFLPSGEPATPECQKINDEVVDAASPLAASGGGRSVIAWIEDEEGPGKTTWIKARVFAAGGEDVSGELLVDTFPRIVTYIALGVDAGGRFLILWWSGNDECTLFGQRFTPEGAPLGARFALAEAMDEISGECLISLSMAMASDGSFAVAWAHQENLLRLQRFRPQGTPESTPVDFPGVNFASLAGDRYGNLALLRPDGIQLFNRHLVSQGPLLTNDSSVAPWMKRVALGDRLLAVWIGPLKPGASSSILGKIWDVRRDADACAYRGDRFLFDTAGDGGEPDVIIPFGSGQAVPLLGDFNGDGRDDPCLYQDGRFFCDTAHDGAGAEKQTPRFGQPGDVPLMGDLDGDGRDDPCIRRGKTFLCDSDRNGKTDRSITFGRPGDQAVIGDVDGDGRGDPCVARKGVFLCDSAHNGGGAETQLRLSVALSGLPEGTPALGDINGDGREDPCVFVDGRLLCGLFAKGAKLPASIVDRPFGEPGDVFLLGDLDAF